MLDTYLAHRDLCCVAVAGAGKTSTLELLANADTSRRALYLAFNREIRDEAHRRFPKRVKCSTAHSLAYKALGHELAHKLPDQVGRMRPEHVFSALGAHRFDTSTVPWSGILRHFIIPGVERFCQSDATTPQPEHLQMPPQLAVFQTRALRVLDALWKHMIDPSNTLPITHDTYLKAWTLRRPEAPAPVVYFDEAQDANPVLVDLVKTWSTRDGAQLVVVGDPYQQIYSWRGATNALEQFDGAIPCTLSRSWRYGENIARLSNLVLQRLARAPTHHVVHGNPARQDQVAIHMEWPESGSRAMLMRTNAGMIAQVYKAIKGDLNPWIAGGTKDLVRLLEAADKLRSGEPLGDRECPELLGFDTWEDVECAAEGPDGQDLKVLVSLVSQFKLDSLIGVLKWAGRKQRAPTDLILCTAHRSKGLEFDHVKLGNDFRGPDHPDFTPEEANLLYVAITRAKTSLDIGGGRAICAALIEPDC